MLHSALGNISSLDEVTQILEITYDTSISRVYSITSELGLVSIGILSIYGAMCSIMIILLTTHYRSLVFCRGTIGPISSSEREPTKIMYENLSN